MSMCKAPAEVIIDSVLAAFDTGAYIFERNGVTITYARDPQDFVHLHAAEPSKEDPSCFVH